MKLSQSSTLLHARRASDLTLVNLHAGRTRAGWQLPHKPSFSLVLVAAALSLTQLHSTTQQHGHRHNTVLVALNFMRTYAGRPCCAACGTAAAGKTHHFPLPFQHFSHRYPTEGDCVSPETELLHCFLLPTPLTSVHLST